MEINAQNITICRACQCSAKDIADIKSLQQSNLKRCLSEEEALSEGFVTAEYSLEFLQSINDIIPSIVARNGDELVGYSLIITKESGKDHDLLNDLIQSIDEIEYKGRFLKETAYILGGQLCVKKGYRGQRLPQRMYSAIKEATKDKYSYCITDVARSNPRSLKAHIHAGFQVVDVKSYGGFEWDIVLLDYQTDS